MLSNEKMSLLSSIVCNESAITIKGNAHSRKMLNRSKKVVLLLLDEKEDAIMDSS